MKLAERHLMLHQVDVDIRRLLDKVASVKPRKLSSRTLSSSLLRSSSSGAHDLFLVSGFFLMLCMKFLQ